MDLTITSQNKEEYFLIESKGSLQTKEELFRHSQLLFDEIMKHGAQRILINDIETHFPLELSPYFGLVQEYAENQRVSCAPHSKLPGMSFLARGGERTCFVRWLRMVLMRLEWLPKP